MAQESSDEVLIALFGGAVSAGGAGAISAFTLKVIENMISNKYITIEDIAGLIHDSGSAGNSELPNEVWHWLLENKYLKLQIEESKENDK